jgi:type I restriction enzyme, S subunit
MTVADLEAHGVLLVQDGNHGEYRPRPNEFTDDGTPFIRAADLSDGKVRFDKAGRINTTALNRIRKGIGAPGDILFSHKGTVGKLARVPSDSPAFVCSPQTTFWRVVNEGRLRRDYLFAFMRSRRFVDQWWVRKGETDMADYVSLTAQRQLQVTLPPLGIQRRIAQPLAALDDLIDNNRRRVELLEQMAQAIYREWFVHFRYPGHEQANFVDSDLGPIPESWDVQRLFAVADVSFGFSFASKGFSDNGSFPVIRIRDVPHGRTMTFTEEEPPERYRVEDGDVLVGMDGEFHLRQWTGGEAWLNQRVARMRPLNGMAARHLMLAVDGPIKQWNAAITGTTVAHLGKRHLEQIQLVMPPADLLNQATELLNGIADQERLLVQGSRRLALIRDLLLPKLVTGQIDVLELDLEAVVGSVA